MENVKNDHPGFDPDPPVDPEPDQPSEEERARQANADTHKPDSSAPAPDKS